MEKSRLLNVGFYSVCIPSKVVIFYCKSLNSLCYFIDVNECLFEELYTCVDEFQRCVNTLGSYKCECDQGLYFIDGKCRGKKTFTPLRIYFRFSFHFWLEWPGRWPRRTPISRWLSMWPLTVFINVVSKKGRVVWLCNAHFCDWLKDFMPLAFSTNHKSITNHDMLSHVPLACTFLPLEPITYPSLFTEYPVIWLSAPNVTGYWDLRSTLRNCLW